MKVYVSGPISGRENRNETSFRRAAAAITMKWHTAVVPLDIPAHTHDGPCPTSYATGEGHGAACWLRADLVALLACDAVVMLADWELSIGARLEHEVATICGLKVYYMAAESLFSMPEAVQYCSCGSEQVPHAMGSGEWCEK